MLQSTIHGAVNGMDIGIFSAIIPSSWEYKPGEIHPETLIKSVLMRGVSVGGGVNENMLYGIGKSANIYGLVEIMTKSIYHSIFKAEEPPVIINDADEPKSSISKSISYSNENYDYSYNLIKYGIFGAALLIRGADVLNSVRQKSTLDIAIAFEVFQEIRDKSHRLLNKIGKTDDGSSALFLAVSKGNQGEVEKLLHSGAKPNAVDKNGWSLLMVAASKGHQGAVDSLLDAGANPNAVCENGWPPLMSAASKGHQGMVDSLLNAGANPNVTGKNGWSPLMRAADKGHQGAVDSLLKAGANPNATDKDGWSPLMCAASTGHQGTVDSLLNAGANPNAADKNGLSPLLRAASKGHQGVVDSLLDAGANQAANKEGWTPLRVAKSAGHQGIVKSLQNADAKQNAADDHARSDAMRTGVREVPAEQESVDICFVQEAPLSPLDDGAFAHEFITESRVEFVGLQTMGTSFDMYTPATPMA